MSLSLIVWLMYQDREPTKSAQAACFQAGIVTPSSLVTSVETFRSARTVGYSGRTPAGPLFATARPEANANFDNGMTVLNEGGETHRIPSEEAGAG